VESNKSVCNDSCQSINYYYHQSTKGMGYLANSSYRPFEFFPMITYTGWEALNVS